MFKDIEQRYEFDIDVKKAKTMEVILPERALTAINLVSNGQKLEEVTQFEYLGAIFFLMEPTQTN